MQVNDIMYQLEAKHQGESEFLQAVREVLDSIEEVYNQHPEFEKAGIVERIVEPDRIFTFRVLSSHRKRIKAYRILLWKTFLFILLPL